MGFLDDLKRQAQELQSREQGDSATRERHTQLCEAACRSAFAYLDSLAAQLRVIKPVAPTRYLYDRQNVVDGLRLTDVQVDERQRQFHGNAVIDHVVLHGHRRSGRRIALVRNFPADIDRLEARLRQGGVPFDAQTQRDPVHGKVVEVRYDFAADVAVRVRLVPDHANARIAFQVHNLDGLESISCELPAVELTHARLDELARWIVGEPHRFLEGAQRIARQEP